MTQTPSKMLVTLAVLFLTSATSFAQKQTDIESIGARDINRGGFQATMSVEDEIKLGHQLSLEFEQSVKLLRVPAITEYVDRIGQNVARNSDVKSPVTIKVVDSPDINATTLPGGFIYVNAGLITAADSEAELATMMAHAIAHVAARHAAELHGRATLFAGARVPLVAPSSSLFTIMPTAMPSSLQVQMTFLKFDRAAQEEADWLGLQYAYKAGYDPKAMVIFFQKMTALAPAATQVSSLFSTHPPTEERARKADTNITRFLPPRQQNIVTTAEFDQVKAQLVTLRPQ